MITASDIAHELLLDHIERKRQCFNLVKFVPGSPCSIDIVPFVVAGYKYHSRVLMATYRKSTELLLRSFPLLPIILNEPTCTIIAAGGAIAKSFWMCDQNILQCDIDLFVIAGVHFDATAMLLGLLTKLKDQAARTDTTITIIHNAHTVTVFHSDATVTAKYQFVLRIYPSIGHVLGGFDIPASAVCVSAEKYATDNVENNSFLEKSSAKNTATDNAENNSFLEKSSAKNTATANDGATTPTFTYYATRLGDWSCRNRIIIADTSRRSTSYEARLQKYSGYCSIVIPGIAITDIHDHIMDARARFELAQNEYCAQRDVCAIAGTYRYEYLTQEVARAVKEIKDLAIRHGVEVRIDTSSLRQVDKPVAESIIYNMRKVCKWYGFHMTNRVISDTMTFSYSHFHLYVRNGGVGFAANGGLVSDYGEVNMDRTRVVDPKKQQSIINRRLARLGYWDAISSIIEITPTQVCKVTLPWVKNVFAEHILRNLNIVFVNWRVCLLPTRESDVQGGSFTIYQRGEMKYKHLLKRQPPIDTLFGENAPEVWQILRQKIEPESAPDVIEQLRRLTSLTNDRLEANMDKLKNRPITWLRENPGRQWTASFNPVFERPADWYQPMQLVRADPKIGAYRPSLPQFTPLRIICAEYGRLFALERELWRLRLRDPFRCLPLDIHKHIIMIVLITACI